MGLDFFDFQPLYQQKCSGKKIGVLAQPGFNMHHKYVLNFDPTPWLSTSFMYDLSAKSEHVATFPLYDSFCIAELQVLRETIKENKCEDEHQ